jgi:hypothetical protein
MRQRDTLHSSPSTLELNIYSATRDILSILSRQAGTSKSTELSGHRSTLSSQSLRHLKHSGSWKSPYSHLGHTEACAFFNMYSTLSRLNHVTSLATTYIMILLGLISVSSYLSLPVVDGGRIEVKDLIL